MEDLDQYDDDVVVIELRLGVEPRVLRVGQSMRPLQSALSTENVSGA